MLFIFIFPPSFVFSPPSSCCKSMLLSSISPSFVFSPPSSYCKFSNSLPVWNAWLVSLYHLGNHRNGIEISRVRLKYCIRQYCILDVLRTSKTPDSQKWNPSTLHVHKCFLEFFKTWTLMPKPQVHHMHTHLSCNSLNPKPWCLNPKYTSLYTHLFCNFLNPNPWCLNPKYATHIHLSCNSLNP